MPAGDDDESAADGQHAVDRGGLQDADDVVGLQETGGRQLKKTINPIRLANASSFWRALGLKTASLSRRNAVEFGHGWCFAYVFFSGV